MIRDGPDHSCLLEFLELTERMVGPVDDALDWCGYLGQNDNVVSKLDLRA